MVLHTYPFSLTVVQIHFTLIWLQFIISWPNGGNFSYLTQHVINFPQVQLVESRRSCIVFWCLIRISYYYNLCLEKGSNLGRIIGSRGVAQPKEFLDCMLFFLLFKRKLLVSFRRQFESLLLSFEKRVNPWNMNLRDVQNLGTNLDLFSFSNVMKKYAWENICEEMLSSFPH